MLTLAETWKTEMSRSGVEPIYIVDLELGPAAFFTVNNYALGAGQTITVLVNGSSTPDGMALTEGTHFSRGSSNTECATNIINAINTIEAGLTTPMIAAGSRNASGIITSRHTSVDTLTITTSSAAAWSATPDPVQRHTKLCSGEVALDGCINIVSHVSPCSASIDVVTRKTTIGNVDLYIADNGVIRETLILTRPLNKRVTLTLGCLAISQSDFAPAGVYTIDDIRPEPGGVVLQLTEPLMWVVDSQIVGQFVCIHPLAAIKKLLELSGIPDDFIDSASLDSTDSRYSAISHWAVSRHSQYPKLSIGGRQIMINETGIYYPDSGIRSPSNARDIIDDLSLLTTGALNTGEDGVYTFTRYNPARSVSRNLTDDDVDQFIQESTYNNVATRVQVSGIQNGVIAGGATQSRTPLFTYIDTYAEASIGIAGNNRSRFKAYQTDWLGMPAFLADHESPSDPIGTIPADIVEGITSTDTIIHTYGAAIAGFCGTRPQTRVVLTPDVGSPSYAYDANPPAAQRSADTASADRPVYLLITDGNYLEIVEATGYVAKSQYNYNHNEIHHQLDASSHQVLTTTTSGSATAGQVKTYTDPDVISGTENWYYDLGEWTIRTRGALGTVARAWVQTFAGQSGSNSGSIRIYDITIAISTAQAQVERLSSGCPSIRINTNLTHMDLQLGDFVTVPNDLYLHFRKNGSDTSTVFEIVSKEVKALDDQPGIEFILAWARDDVTVAVSPGYDFPLPGTPLPPPPSPDDIITDNDDVPVTDEGDVFVTR